jgi:RNA polymerase sigma-70 factor (ECF subfamily)
MPAEERTDPDSDVLDLVAKGDMTGALRLLMNRYGTAVYRFCREALRDATLAEDVQQQVFIQSFRDLPRFRRQASVRTWLFAIAHHRVLDAVKARNRQKARIEPGEPAEVPDSHPSPGDRIDDARLRAALVTCLEELPENVQTALLLRFQQGFTFEEMAKVCGKKSGTLQAQVMRALPDLRDCIKRCTGGAL